MGVTGKLSGEVPAQQLWLLRLLPSFTDFAFLLPILFLFAGLRGAKTLLGDGDTGWHIRTGEWIITHGMVPRTDIFSFSKPGEPWFAWEWGWDILFAGIHTHWGLAGVVFVNAVLLGVVAALLFRLVRTYTENDVLGFAITALAMGVSSIHWLARPHLLGWVLLLICCHIVQRVRRGNLQLLWVTPILIALWTNVHGSFFVGIALLAANGIGDLAGAWLWHSGIRRHEETVRGLWFCGAAALCSLATLANPYGMGLHEHVLRYLFDGKQLENIGEYQSVSFHSPMATCFEVMLFLAAAAVCWSWKQRRLADAMVLAGWAHLALVSSRNIPLFVFFAAPVIAGMLQDVAARAAEANRAEGVMAGLARRFRDMGLEHRPIERAWRFHLSAVAGVAVLAILFAAPGRPNSLVAEYDRHDYPAEALKVLRERDASRIFADDEWGDYLIYNLYPKYRVFIDGRSDFYGADFDQKQLDLINAHHGWQSQLSRYAIDTVLVRADVPLAGVLKESSRWSLVYDDGIATVFRSVASVPQPSEAAVSHQKLSSVSPDVGRRLPAHPAGKLQLQTLKFKKIGRRNS